MMELISIGVKSRNKYTRHNPQQVAGTIEIAKDGTKSTLIYAKHRWMRVRLYDPPQV